MSGGGRLEHRQNARMIEVTCSDAFKVRTDTAQFGGHKIVDKMQAPIQPGKQLILDVPVLGGLGENLTELPADWRLMLDSTINL